MSNIISNEDGDNATLIAVGDSNRTVSIKDYQDIYHQITGRTEQIRKRYSEFLLIDFDEIKQLHTKITQLLDVHNCVAKNLVVSVFHEKERKEQFTSFERFQTYNSSTTSPTVSLLLSYNFSIIPAGIQKAQEYSIKIRLTSRVALSKQIDEDSPPFVRSHMVKFINEPVAEITVDYVDYVIARGFIESFEEWVKGCKSTPKSKLLDKAQEFSYLIPRTLSLIITLLVSYLAFLAIPKLELNNQSIDVLARFGIIFLAGNTFLSSLSSLVGSRIERVIDGYPVLSYIKLNRGDARYIDNYIDEKKSATRKFIIYCVLNILLGIIATKLEKLI